MTATLSASELAALDAILAKLAGPGAELPPVLFRFVTEIAATSNVDLLVLDDAGRVLLAWRDDAFGRGWHVPGSIIRHREEIAHRIAACAAEEFGCALQVAAGPAALVQIFDDRGHSVSLCFTARLAGLPGRRVVEPGEAAAAGDLRWFDALPDALYPSHGVYREVVAAVRAGSVGRGIAVFAQHTGGRDAGQVSVAGVIAADQPLDSL